MQYYSECRDCPYEGGCGGNCRKLNNWYPLQFDPSFCPPATVTTKGCICQPTSEQTCQNEFCPRKSTMPAKKENE